MSKRIRSDAFSEGEQACYDGCIRNPYDEGTPEHDAYEAGVKAASPIREQWEDNCQDHFDATDGVTNCDDWGTGEGRYHGRM